MLTAEQPRHRFSPESCALKYLPPMIVLVAGVMITTLFKIGSFPGIIITAAPYRAGLAPLKL